MNEEDKKTFLEDFKKVDIQKKFDMWLYALDQESRWEETIEEMSTIATKLSFGKATVAKE